MQEQSQRRKRRHWLIWLFALILICAAAYEYFVHTKSSQTQHTAPPTPQSVLVTAVAATQGDIHIYIKGLGSVTSIKTVTVKSRIDGQVMHVYYREGQIVRSGDKLLEIDPRPYEVQLTQAEGQMVRDQALLENARLDLQRYAALAKEDSIAKQQYDTQKSLVRQYEGAVKVDQGQIDNAKLQLVYSRITAPIGGRIGLRAVDEGNIVHATDTTGLLVITQIEPMTVIFPIPEDDLPQLLDKIKAGQSLPVDAFNREETRKLSTGYLLAHDNQIDPTTGTIRLRAEFPNKNHELFPNQFVNARVLVDIKHGVTVIPVAAIQRSPQGTFVYLVKPDMTVAAQPVKIGPSEGNDVSIDEGLSPGDLVVVEGADRLRDGSRVELKNKGTATPGKGN